MTDPASLSENQSPGASLSNQRTEVKSPAIAGRQAASVGLASLMAAASGYVVIWFAPIVLSKADNAEFLAFWSALFLLFGVIGGLQTEVIRSSSYFTSASPVARSAKPVRLLSVVAGLAACVAVLVLATGPLWGPAVLGTRWWLLCLVLAGAAALFCFHSALAGALSGQQKWGHFSALIAGEALLRLVVVIAIGVLAASTSGLAVGAGAGACAWVVLVLLSGPARRALATPLDVRVPDFLRKVGHASMSTAASAVLVVGFPILYRITTSEATYLASAPLLLAIVLTRAPLMVPLGTFQSVAVSHFVQNRDAGLAAMRPIALALAGVAFVGSVAAYFLGPWLMSLLFGADYRVDGWVLAGLMLAASVLALLTLTGGMCVALDRHRVSSAGWVSASVVAFFVLLLPLGPDLRAVTALVVGPVVGLIIHVTALSRRTRTAVR